MRRRAAACRCCASPATLTCSERYRGQSGITKRIAPGIVSDLADVGYVVKEDDGWRNRDQIQARLPLSEVVTGDLPSAKSSPPCQPGTARCGTARAVLLLPGPADRRSARTRRNARYLHVTT